MAWFGQYTEIAFLVSLSFWFYHPSLHCPLCSPTHLHRGIASGARAQVHDTVLHRSVAQLQRQHSVSLPRVESRVQDEQRKGHHELSSDGAVETHPRVDAASSTVVCKASLSPKRKEVEVACQNTHSRAIAERQGEGWSLVKTTISATQQRNLT